MRNPFRRRRPNPTATPRPDPLRIAVLEHQLLGITPEPGTAAALAVALSQLTRKPASGPCDDHQLVETTGLADTVPTALCGRCGTHLVHDHEQRTWRAP